MPVAWTPNMAVGVDQIDDQHKELFKRVNDLLEASSQGKGKEEIARILQFLGDHVVVHFSNEERLMARFPYPGAIGHKEEHLKFMGDFGELRKQYDAQGASLSIVLEVQRRVCDWLIKHIARVDKEFGAFLKTRM